MKFKKDSLLIKAPALHEPIAIVGMSCRFPKAPDLKCYWELLSSGKDTVTEIPSERWDHARYFSADPSASNKTNQRHASMLANIHDFDPLFFGISPAEAFEMSPSQKLMLELVWEAIENSLMPMSHFEGKKAGVYIGNIWNDFEHLRKHKNAAATSHSAMGQCSNIIANRISFCYGLTGPSLVVDTGCSSSLVALHLACQSLWDNSTEMSVVGGVNHILDPEQYILLTKFGGLSVSGKCSAFDSDADGFVRGEGGGVVLLKKLSDAEMSGDRIYALIRGTAMNNNGHNINLPATSIEGQKAVLADAYKNSGIAPADIHYVEAHGTGTKLGDPTEARALGEFFCNDRHHSKLHVGSVKTNLGHLEGAAGMAGLIKAVLAIQNKLLPPSLNFRTPNPDIPFETLGLHVQTTCSAWPTRNMETLKAGINSFGWGGTNAHTVIEEYKKTEPRNVPCKEERYCLPISAQSPDALKAYIKIYIDAAAGRTEDAFRDICLASAILKPSLPCRAFFSANDKEGMLKALEDFQPDIRTQTSHPNKNKIVMIFPGQGAQWYGMGRELFAKEPVFRQQIECCDNAFKPYVSWSLIEQLMWGPEESMNEIDIIQPALFAIQVSLARLWMSRGIKPHALAGHSMGEVAAAHTSGALNLDDAARIICTRSILMKRLSGRGGAMAVTELSLENAETFLLRYPQLSVAVNNSPKSTVLAGDQRSISEVISELESKGLFSRQVKVDVASHSQQMEPLKQDLYYALQNIKPQASSIPIYSTVKSRVIHGEDLHAEYWTDNLRNPVRFSDTVKQLMDDGHTMFIEISPHPILVGAINECAEYENKKIIAVGSLYRDKPEQESIYSNVGQLFLDGYNANWKAFFRADRTPDIQLPSYPFQRERYELEDRSERLGRIRKTNRKSPLLGNAFDLAASDNIFFRETDISVEEFPFLRDHQVNEAVVVPGVTYIEMVLEIAAEIQAEGIAAITNVEFVKSITLSSDEAVTIQLKVTRDKSMYSFWFYKKTFDTVKDVTWDLLARGNFEVRAKVQQNFAAFIPEENNTLMQGHVYYESLKWLGLQYGPHFQGLKQFTQGGHSKEIRFRLIATEPVRQSVDAYKIHPALLDACLQPLFFTELEGSENKGRRTTFLTGIRDIQLLQEFNISDDFNGVAKFLPVKQEANSSFSLAEADITIYSNNGESLLIIKGVQAKIIGNDTIESLHERIKNWLYNVSWIKLKENTPVHSEKKPGTLIVMGDPHDRCNGLVKKLKEKFDCIYVSPGEYFTCLNANEYIINFASKADYGKLLEEIFRGNINIEGIIHAASLNYTWKDGGLTAKAIEAQQVYGSRSLLFLYQQLFRLRPAQPLDLVIITNGVQNIASQKDVQPLHSPLFGIAKVMRNESPHYNIRYFDMSAGFVPGELDCVAEEIQKPHGGENEIAFRKADQYVARLQAAARDTVLPFLQSRTFSSGTYVITGFHGIAFYFIEWMAQKGASDFALISRTGETSGNIQERISVLRSNGCNIQVFAADAGDFDALKKTFEQIENTMPPIAGVVHAAGVIKANALTDISQDEFLSILNPKVKGAWNLHLLTQHRPLDCFIMFSSAAALIGLNGLGSYVAANAFLDTLAHHRKAMGLAGLSVNWGVMADAGMVAKDSALERHAKAEGFEIVTMTSALEAFDHVICGSYAQAGIMKFHPEVMANYYTALRKTNYFKGLLEKTDNARSLQKDDFTKKFSLLSSEDERIEILENLVIQEVAVITKTASTFIQPSTTFKGLGIDSIMSIQLRNRIEKKTGLKLSAGMFGTYPSMREFASSINQSLTEKLSLGQPSSAISVDNNVPDWFVIPNPNPEAAFRIFCFHDAGGDSDLYSGWETSLGGNFELIAVVLPGRGRRIGQNNYINVEHLIADLKPALLPYLDKPYVFFGHSMGGLLAFEISRSLRIDNINLPSKIFISSTPALNTYSQNDIDYTRLEKDLFNEKHDDEQSLKLLLRNDLQILKHYRYVREEPLTIPLIVIYGLDDARVKKEQAEKWKRETQSTCVVISRPGGHRYIEKDSRFLTDMIRKMLTSGETNSLEHTRCTNGYDQ